MKIFNDFSPRVIKILDFGFTLKALLSLMLINLLFLVLKIDVNLVVFYAPILYLYICNNQNSKTINLSFIAQNLLLAIVVVLIKYSLDPLIASAVFFAYTMTYFLLIYKKLLHKNGNDFFVFEFSYLSVMSLLMVVSSLSVFALNLMTYLGYDIFSRNKYLCIVASFLYIFFSLISLRAFNRSTCKEELPAQEDVQIDTCTKEELVKNKIDHFFETELIFLDTSFSLERLAECIDEGKEITSIVLNHYMNTNFYQIVAKYRIAHAKRLIVTEHNFTIDAIMEECGFNSKSSFNKYFKQFVGSTPSMYRNTYSVM